MWIEYLRIALGVLRGHKFRSLLTVMSITIGAFSIVLMTSLADSGLKTLMAGMEELGGARLISIWSKTPDEMEEKRMSYSRGLTRQDAAALSGLPHMVRMTTVSSLRKGMTADSGKQANADVLGVDLSGLDFFSYRVSAGRMFDEHDMAEHAQVCLVGYDLLPKLWDKGEQVLSHTVTVLGIRCRVIGTLAQVDRFGGGFGWDWDKVLVLPLETLADHDAKEIDLGRNIILRTDAPSHNEIVKRIMNTTLLERHHGVSDFSIFDFDKVLTGFFRIFAIMQAVVGLLAGIALLVGGVGIMNIMLVSVSERVREIGIRKALGASPNDIGRQFLVEATLLSSVGGLTGVVSGVVMALLSSQLIRHFKPRWVSTISEPAVIVALVTALGIGVTFGYFPARRASKLDAVLAIRT